MNFIYKTFQNPHTHLIHHLLRRPITIPSLFRHLQHHNAPQLARLVRTIDPRHRHRVRTSIHRIILTEIDALRGHHHLLDQPRAAPRIAGQVDVVKVKERRQVHRVEAIVRHAQVSQRGHRLQKVLRVQLVVRQIDGTQLVVVGKGVGRDVLQLIGGHIDSQQLAHRGESGTVQFDQLIVGHVEQLQLVEVDERVQVGDGIATEIE